MRRWKAIFGSPVVFPLPPAQYGQQDEAANTSEGLGFWQICQAISFCGCRRLGLEYSLTPHRTLDLVVTLPGFLSRPVKLYVWTEDESPWPSCIVLALNGMAHLFLVDEMQL